MANMTKYDKAQAITNTVAGTSPAKTYTPTVGSVSTTATTTFGDSILYGGPTENTLLVISDDLVTKYAD